MDFKELVDQGNLAIENLKPYDISELVNDRKNNFDIVVRQIIAKLDEQIKDKDEEIKNHIENLPTTYHKLITYNKVSYTAVVDFYKRDGVPKRTKKLEKDSKFLKDFADVEESYEFFESEKLRKFVDDEIKSSSILVKILKKFYSIEKNNLISRYINKYYNVEIEKKYSELVKEYCDPRGIKKMSSRQLASILDGLVSVLYEEEDKIMVVKQKEKESLEYRTEDIQKSRSRRTRK